MRVLYRGWIVCIVVAYVGVVSAAPRVSAQAQYKAASAQLGNGNYQKALELIEQGLAVAPKDLKLLGLKGSVLLELRDYPAALAAYQAYVTAAPPGRNRDEAEKIVAKLLAVRTTFLDITVTNGPADVYLDSKTQGTFCRAAPTCHEAVLPLDYKVIAERPGFERWANQVTIESGKVTQLSVTLTEKPSTLAVKVTPEGAAVMVDGAPHDPAKPVVAGEHRIVVSLAGHGEEQRTIEAREGKPIEVEVALAPLVPIRVAPAGAELLLDGKPVTAGEGGIAVPPGAHKLKGRAPEFRDREIEVPAERGTGYEIVIELERIPPYVPPPPPPPTPSLFTGRRKVALAAGGVGVAALGAGILLGLQAKGLDGDAFELCPSPSTPCSKALEANDLNERGRSRALTANVAYGVAGGAAIAAAILWLTGAPESRVAVTPRLGGVAGLDLGVRF